ncbi:MAG: prepilin-type N-terminal cleavage/methylation domain-containing protein, partial [Acidobacteria bacterium]|nr:prepilin-type N-terminal cleavage/methylation domain-containing protein [Acidobacteriota bacterium]
MPPRIVRCVESAGSSSGGNIAMKNTTGFRLGTAGAGAKGFGILEVLAAVAVVSILLSVGVPNLDRWSRQWDLQGSLHMLETSLLWGRMHAIAANS